MARKIIKKCINTLCVAAALVAASAFAAGLLGAEEAVSVAAGKYTVVVDAGHGGPDGGAVGVHGTVEAGLNLTVAQLLKAELERRGVTVIMTRETVDALGDTKKADMAARGRIIAMPEADVVVSVHMNKFTDCSVHGSMAYYMQGSDEGGILAQCVIDAVTDITGQGRRDANPGDYFVLRKGAAPSVLVECGFLSNSEDEAKLTDEAYQRLLAKGIADGVCAYLFGGEDITTGQA